MMRPLAAAVAVLAAAVVSVVLYDIVLGAARGAVGLHWRPIVEGLLTGGAVIGVWQLTPTRVTAATGLGVALVLVAVGASSGHALAFAREPMGWAVIVALASRLAAPAPTPAESSDGPRERVEA